MSRHFRQAGAFVLILLIIEFLDELVFGAGEAAWPLIRDDLGLSYAQIGLLLSLPKIFTDVVEPILGILSDVWKRRALILGGGIAFALTLALAAISRSFFPFLIACLLSHPASGAFVSLSQAALMDTDPDRHEYNMARWTFAGALGVVIGPLALSGAVLAGPGWRGLYLLFVVLSLVVLVVAWRFPFGKPNVSPDRPNGKAILKTGLLGALRALRRGDVWRWLILLEFANCMMDVLYSFLALYFVDAVGFDGVQAGFAVALWSGAALVGDLLLIPLLERVAGLRWLRISVLIMLGLFPAFLLVSNTPIKLVLLALLGLFAAGWYAIPKGQLYSTLPEQSGTVMALSSVSGLFGSLMPLVLGLVAEHYGLTATMWLLLAGPIALLIGLPRHREQ
jgi:FSR family fosmidomycin resistance protein-like MFS transporter